MDAWVWFTHVHDRGTPSIHMCLQWHTEAAPFPSNLRLSLLYVQGGAGCCFYTAAVSFLEEPGDLSQFMRRVTHYLTVFKTLQHVFQTNNASLAASTSSSSR